MHPLLLTVLVLYAAAQSLPPGFVYLSLISPRIIEEIRYSGIHNFVGHQITGYMSPKCILTKQAADGLHRVQLDLLKRNSTLKVYDCYRPTRATRHFVNWARNITDTLMKGEFYTEIDKSRLFVEGYISDRSGHSRGSTIDLTVVSLPPHAQDVYRRGDPLRSCTLPRERRFRDNSIDMGTGYDCFNVKSHTDSPLVTPGQRQNRLTFKSLMELQGFSNYAKEWWHFTLKNEPFKDTYFDFEIR
jgi:D-alanyl-D-alanine dipeptidase